MRSSCATRPSSSRSCSTPSPAHCSSSAAIQETASAASSAFGGPGKVLEYLGRYTHRVAISNHRIQAVEDGNVRFSWRDRRDGDAVKAMTVSAEEFIRRFLLHALPRSFMRIRSFGFLANR